MVTVESKDGRVGIAPQEEISIPTIMDINTRWFRFIFHLKFISSSTIFPFMCKFLASFLPGKSISNPIRIDDFLLRMLQSFRLKSAKLEITAWQSPHPTKSSPLSD